MDPRHVSHSNDSSSALVVAGDRLALQPTKLPVPVILLWVCALAGLAVYTASWYVPSLAQLGR